MLGTPKALRQAIEGGQSPETGVWKRQRNYGRLARSDEHPAGVAISGRESGHALQIRRRAENSGIQTGQPLALQEIAAGPVDGREVERDGTADETETEGGVESCGVIAGSKAEDETPSGQPAGRRRYQKLPGEMPALTKVGTCLEWDRSQLLAWM